MWITDFQLVRKSGWTTVSTQRDECFWLRWLQKKLCTHKTLVFNFDFPTYCRGGICSLLQTTHTQTLTQSMFVCPYEDFASTSITFFIHFYSLTLKQHVNSWGSGLCHHREQRVPMRCCVYREKWSPQGNKCMYTQKSSCRISPAAKLVCPL